MTSCTLARTLTLRKSDYTELTKLRVRQLRVRTCAREWGMGGDQIGAVLSPGSACWCGPTRGIVHVRARLDTSYIGSHWDSIAVHELAKPADKCDGVGDGNGERLR
jgi:hypothetical protein